MLVGLWLATPLWAQVSFEYDLPGNLDSQSNLVTIPAPQFQQAAPFYVIANPNGLVSVSAPITGVGPFSFQWLLNGTAIAGATNASFVLTDTTTPNLGAYQLVARNASGAATSAVVTVSFDTDHSGLPDAWQIEYFGQLGVDPNADPDGDGVSNYEEYLDGTNPTNANSVDPRLYLNSTIGGTAGVTPLLPKYQHDESVQLTAVAIPGYSFIGWSGSITNTNTTVNLVMNMSKTVTADFGLPLGVVLDATNLVWTTGGNSGWFGETNISFDGVSAAQSGLVLVGQQTWLQTTVANAKAVEVAFQWTVSSEQGANFLNFNVNGTSVNSISGGQGLIIWQHQVCLLGPGANVLNWVYAQSVADNDYGWIDLDTGWLDEVHVIPLVLTPGSTDVIAWGNDTNGEVDVPPGLNDVVSLAAGQYHSMALKSNGTIVAWGYNGDGETNVPPAATDVAAISSGWYHNLAVTHDGTVVAWGNNAFGQATVPSGLNSVVAVAGGGQHSLALKSNGAVAAWGLDASGQTDIPSGLSNVVAIAAGGLHSLALTTDGAVVAWGNDSYLQTNVPPGLANVTAIAAGDYFSLALTSGGAVVGWGDNSYNQLAIPLGLSNVVGIAAGAYYSLALLSDGSLVSWGDDTFGQADVPVAPPGVGGFVAIAGGGYHALALLNDGAPVIASQVFNQTVYSGVTAAFNAGTAGAPLSYQWRFNGTNISGATSALLSLPNAQSINVGSYSVVISNSLGSITSANATLAVIHSGPIITAQPASVALSPGDNTTFSIAAVGSLPLIYRWQFGNTNIPGATSTNLNFLGVTASQAGTYDVVVTNLYGSVTSSLATLTVAESASGVVFSNLHSFGTIMDNNGDVVDGSIPDSALMLDTDGNLYGTASEGGEYGVGTVFRVTTAGTLTNLYSFGEFQDTNGVALDGSNPYGALMQDVNGGLYGTTFDGGSNDLGTVFRITPGGALTTLYSFGQFQDTNGNVLDGEGPRAALVSGPNNSLYLFGTTSGGGSQSAGTAYRVTTNGALTNLHSFGTIQDVYGDFLDGANPYAPLLVGPDGNLFGTTTSAGSNFGTVFRMTTNGALTTLYSFGTIQDTNGNALDGSTPQAPLIIASDGNFYSTTSVGGTNTNGFGTVFRLTTNGTLTTLYSFGAIQDTNGQALDGANPDGGLVQGSNGELYGTTSQGGKDNNGTVFQITTNGTLLTLYRFTGFNDGANPEAGLVLLGNTLYGTASFGGSAGSGTVFSITLASAGPPPAPPGLAILRSGTNLTLMWPTDAVGFTLQSTTNIALPGLWTPVSPAPVIVSGQYTVTTAPSNHQMFYRLAQ
jgi:uncharacterized repeat protein (TIGR03803 family)